MVGTALAIAALQQATLTGVVRDSVDLEPIAFAWVTVTRTGGEAAPASASSDRFGAFVVPAIGGAGPVRVEVRAFGYSVWAQTYEAVPSDLLRVLLAPAPFGLEALEAIAAGRAGDPLSISRDAFVIDSVVLRSIPTILETDVLRATAVSPSASASSDYVSVPFIRGGTSDGTPVLLDGVRLFNAYHLGGFLSAVNAEVVDRATLLTGPGGDGFAIGSLSGAIDIATRDGSRDRMRTSGALGLASARLSVEGPAGASVSSHRPSVAAPVAPQLDGDLRDSPCNQQLAPRQRNVHAASTWLTIQARAGPALFPKKPVLGHHGNSFPCGPDYFCPPRRIFRLCGGRWVVRITERFTARTTPTGPARGLEPDAVSEGSRTPHSRHGSNWHPLLMSVGGGLTV